MALSYGLDSKYLKNTYPNLLQDEAWIFSYFWLKDDIAFFLENNKATRLKRVNQHRLLFCFQDHIERGFSGQDLR